MSQAILRHREQGLAVRIRPGDGERILWLHGYTLDSSIWEPLWELLPGWHHVGVDLPGHGDSEPLARGEDLGRLATRLCAWADSQGIRHLAAISFGGSLALQMAIQAPGAFTTLILGSPAISGGPPEPQSQTRNLELLHLYRQRGPGPWLGELWMRSPPDIFKGAEAHPALWNHLREVVSRHAWRELGEETMRGITGFAQGASGFRQIRAATSLFIGEADMPTFKRYGEVLRRSIPRCERVHVPGAGHLGLLELTHLLAPRIEKALRDGGGLTPVVSGPPREG